VQKSLAVVAMQRRIEEERRRKVWATASYSCDYQQACETVRSHTQETMEVDALASAAGSGGVKREREEEDVGVKDSSPKKAKTVEGPAYLPPVPATTLTPGGIESQAQPVDPLKR